MSKYSGMFIPRSLKPSSIHEILNKPNATLEELFDNEEFSYELKNCNPRLMDYFTKNTERIVQLIDYVIKMPEDPNDQKRAFKYPFLACEIFEKDIATIINAILTAPMPKSKENTTITKQTSLTDDYEVILSGTKSPLKTEEDKAQKSFEENKIEDHLEETSYNSGDMRNSLSSSGKFSRFRPNSKARTLLEYLFSYIETDEELNPVLSGYFFKVADALFRKNPEKVIDFAYMNEGIMLNLVKHLNNKSISELLALLICYDAFQYEEEKPQYLITKTKVIDSLIRDFSTIDEMDTSTNTANVLCEIISKTDIIVDGKEIAAQITTEQNLDKIISLIQSKDNVIVQNVCNVLSFIIDYLNPARPARNLSLSYKLQRQNRDLDNEPVTICLYKNIETFVEILSKDNPSHDNILTSFGTSLKPLGVGRLRIIEVVEKVLKINSKKIYQRIQESGLIKIITNLFISFPWNNMLHQAYERLIVSIMGRNDPILLKALFEDASLSNIIVESTKESHIELFKKGRKVRKGNLGHIINIANQIIQFSESSTEIKEYLNKCPEWEDFVGTRLRSTNEANNTQMGGYDPKEMLLAKGNYPPKNAMTDELEGEGYPFTNQVNPVTGTLATAEEIKSNYALANSIGNKTEATLPAFQTVKVGETVQQTTNTNISPQVSKGNLSPERLSPEKIAENNDQLQNSRTSKSYEPTTESDLRFLAHKEEHKSYRHLSLDAGYNPDGTYSNSQWGNNFIAALNENVDKNLSDIPSGHEDQDISLKRYTSLGDDYVHVVTNDVSQDEKDPSKKEIRKLTLVRKSFPASQNHSIVESNPSSARNSLSGNKPSKKVKIKLKKTDSIDGTKVLEALSKYNDIDIEGDSFSNFKNSINDHSVNVNSPAHYPIGTSLHESATFSNNQLSLGDPVAKNFRSKSNS